MALFILYNSSCTESLNNFFFQSVFILKTEKVVRLFELAHLNYHLDFKSYFVFDGAIIEEGFKFINITATPVGAQLY